ncbi:MAG: Uma2 family endonuclease, partial [Pyrinomonadaceae bacterium]
MHESKMVNSPLKIAETAGNLNPAVAGRSYVTFEEYLERSSDTHLCEWVDGEVIEVPGASFEHQNISSFLEAIMKFYVEKNDLGVIIRSPFAMKLEEQRRGREPDIIFV